MNATPNSLGSTAWYEEQERRDAAGQLRAMQQGARDRERLQRGELTSAELDEEMDDELARFGVIEDDAWDALATPKRRHEAMVSALGFDPNPGHTHRE